MQKSALSSIFQSIPKKLFVATASLAALTLSITSFADNSSQSGLSNINSRLVNNFTIAGSSKPKATRPSTIIPAAPDINAKTYVLMDANSGAIIAQKKMDTRRAPASLTKLVTLFIASNALANGQIKLSDKVHITEAAWRQGGSRMFLKEGSNVPVQDLIRGVITASGNDACYALADYIGGNEKTFAQIMNKAADALGMKNSHFVTSNGLPNPNHYTTAHDLAILTRALINDFPQDYKWYKEKWITYNGIKQPNRNRLLWWDTSVDGLKTGHTNAAGWCLIASAKRDQMRLISVVMGAPDDMSRNRDSEALLNWGYRFFESHQLYAANSTISTPRVYLGEHKTVNMGVKQNFAITIPKGQYQNLKATINMDQPLKAPIEAGKAYGSIQVSLDGKPIAAAPLVALANDPTGGLWTKATDNIALMFKGWFK